MTRLRRAARDRLRRVRGEDSAENGFMLIYVLMVTTIVTILVVSTLVTSGGSVIPAQQAAYNQAADAAAMAGVQDFLASADTACSGSHSTVTNCTLTTTESTNKFASSGSYSATFHWKVVSQNASYIRVWSEGKVSNGGITAVKRVLADVVGGVPSDPLDSRYVTQFETQAPDIAQQLFPPGRNIPLDFTNSTLKATNIPNTGAATTMTWSGAPTGTGAGNVNTCNLLYGGTSGRVNNVPANAATPYVDWAESGTMNNGTAFTNYQPCQVSLGHGTQFLSSGLSGDQGEIRSNDAFLISNSYPGGTGPTIGAPIYTNYLYNAATDGSCGAAGQNYRTYNLLCAGYSVNIGGTPTTGSYLPQYVAQMPVWPTDLPTINAGGSNGACWYKGPTRVLLKSDGSAVITSPQTTSIIGSSDPACYGGTPNTTTGLVGQAVPNIATVSHGVLYVQNNGSAPSTTPTPHTNTGWGVVNTRASITGGNSVFYASTTTGPTSTPSYAATATDKPYTPVINDNPSTQADGAWTPQWTSDTTGTTCSAATAFTDLHFYRCYANSGAYDATAYVDLKTAVKTALAATPSTYTSASAVNTLINGKIAVANSNDAANTNPNGHDYTSHRWQVSTVENATGTTTNGCTAGTTSSTGAVTHPNGPLYGDSFFQDTSGTSTPTHTVKVQCFTSTVTLQVGTCSGLSLGLCLLGANAWGNGTAITGVGQTIPQFKVTTSVTTTTDSTSGYTASSSFPINGDVTPYGSGMTTAGPGDLYVEGTPTSTMALVAQNDVVVTNTLKPTTPSTSAIEVVAENDVRVYHPVGCNNGVGSSTFAADVATTYQGFCPNDITGMYTGILPTAAAMARPDHQYTNLLGTSLNDLQINAALFALGNATSSCPKPASGGGFCGGEITTDNYNRGDGMGNLNVTGGMYMAHHGPLGQEWEVADTTATTSRPYSGYHLVDQYQDLNAAIKSVTAVKQVISLVTTSSSLWRVVSLSTTSQVPSA